MIPDFFEGFARAVVTIAFRDRVRVLQPRPLGSPSGRFPFEQLVHIVTAYNPRGLVSDETENATRHRLLLDQVARLGVATIPTVGSAPDGSIAEPGLLIERLDRATAIALGDEFGQSAIYEWSRDSLEVVGVQDGRSKKLGWTLIDRADWDPNPT